MFHTDLSSAITFKQNREMDQMQLVKPHTRINSIPSWRDEIARTNKMNAENHFLRMSSVE
ncbi:hypothetical protein I7I50_04363 [Histoplasma capsulatum G186AR]|uniref:Uncharacterized protein n=1 Tax=Ajellomyces capsulatus TaxID=5037 RepID=A0A8H8CX45_AJECA|nr:hypothetical protein I7I52_05271 [Histoplasma capsulatum]QSS75273.1 hypothetical protein I7I50_04363 [Histoplasma capsulatum G186AR]